MDWLHQLPILYLNCDDPLMLKSCKSFEFNSALQTSIQMQCYNKTTLKIESPTMQTTYKGYSITSVVRNGKLGWKCFFLFPWFLASEFLQNIIFNVGHCFWALKDMCISAFSKHKTAVIKSVRFLVENNMPLKTATIFITI